MWMHFVVVIRDRVTSFPSEPEFFLHNSRKVESFE